MGEGIYVTEGGFVYRNVESWCVVTSPPMWGCLKMYMLCTRSGETYPNAETHCAILGLWVISRNTGSFSCRPCPTCNGLRGGTVNRVDKTSTRLCCRRAARKEWAGRFHMVEARRGGCGEGEREARREAGLDALLRDSPLSVVKLPSAASAFSSLRGIAEMRVMEITIDDECPHSIIVITCSTVLSEMRVMMEIMFPASCIGLTVDRSCVMAGHC